MNQVDRLFGELYSLYRIGDESYSEFLQRFLKSMCYDSKEVVGESEDV